MKIAALDTCSPESQLKADIVIVGGGPAGLTVARQFANTSTEVLLLESGVEKEELAHMELNRVESGGQPEGAASLLFRRNFHGKNMSTFDQESQPFGVRCRVLGGSAIHWGGKSALFDEIDFAERPWVPHSGWPISRDSLTPYFERAAKLLNLGPNLYDERLWSLIGAKIKRPALDPTKLKSVFWQFARSHINPTQILNFAEEFRVLNASNIRVLINATVVRLDLDNSGEAFRGLEVRTLAGQSFYVKAPICVLAAGGVENARLLLISNHQRERGLGNDHDMVGRFLMDHPGTRIGYFKKEDLKAAEYLGFYAVPHNGELIMYSHGLALSAELQAREKLLNTAIYVLPEIAVDDPVEAVKRIARLKSDNVFADLLSTVRSVNLLVKAVGLKLFNSRFTPKSFQRMVINLLMMINPNFLVREFQSKGVPHKLERMGIHVITEQQPDPESRLILSEEKDRFGSTGVKAMWRISDDERKSVQRIGQLLLEELPKAGMPTPVLDGWVIGDRPHDAPLVDMAHIMGTTRMSNSPRTGVVDCECKVHGIGGLYVVGSSVFPTSSHANPTLMLLSLALKTADHLRTKLAAFR